MSDGVKMTRRQANIGLISSVAIVPAGSVARCVEGRELLLDEIARRPDHDRSQTVQNPHRDHGRTKRVIQPDTSSG
jgi:hypothetical protein